MEERIIQYLQYKERNDLVNLLKKCTYNLKESTSYGRGYNSYRTGLQLFTDIKTFEKLKLLSISDEELILEAFHILYPIQDNSIDISWIEKFIDPDLDIPVRNIKIDNQLVNINFEYAVEQIKKIDSKIDNKDYDGAVTNARTLLETLLKQILENNKVEFSNTDDLMDLYKKVSNLLKLNPIEYKEKYFKKILSGFFSIVQGVSEIRNSHSDSHGKTREKYYKIQERHARLTVDSTKSICNYLFLSYKNSFNQNI